MAHTRERWAAPALPTLLVATLSMSPAASAQTDGDKPHDGPPVAWTYAPDGCRFSEVYTHAGLVYAIDRQGSLHALDAAHGKPLWVRGDLSEFNYCFDMAASTSETFPALLVAADNGMHALDFATGETIWHAEFELGVHGPAIAGNVVVAACADGKAYGLRLQTGEQLWQHDFLEDAPPDPEGFSGDKARFSGRPARPGNTATDGTLAVFPVFDQCRAIAVEPATGKRLWVCQTQGWVYARPSIGPLNVYVASQDRHLYAFDKQIGKQAWKVKMGGSNESSAAPTKRFVYYGSCNGVLYAIDQGVGRVAWQFAIDRIKGQTRAIYSRPLVHGDTVYLAAMQGMLYAVNRETGTLRWKLRPLEDSEFNSDIAFDGTRMFITTRMDGKVGTSAVVAVDAR